ncbi:hypothetical protein PM082_013684 [Marasmius tenuissimus]|nr:hypothetical protein PM082_013684 [Marasmius tenuissimus]
MPPAWTETLDGFLTQLTVKRVIAFPIASLTVTYFLYGIYTVLVILCVALLRQDKVENRRFYLVLTLLLFAICTIMVIDETLFRVQESALEYHVATTKDGESFVRYVLYDKMKHIILHSPSISKYGRRVDAYSLMLPHMGTQQADRGTSCGFILNQHSTLSWGRYRRCRSSGSYKVPIRPMECNERTPPQVCGGSGERSRQRISDTVDWYRPFLRRKGCQLSLWMDIAGRIWRINRESQNHLAMGKGATRLSTVARIILESGSIYPTVIIVQMMVGSPPKGRISRVDLYPAVVLTRFIASLWGIAPTLALLRGQIAKLSEKASYKHRSEAISDIHFNSADLAELCRANATNRSVLLEVRAGADGEGGLKIPEPLDHARQSAGTLPFISSTRNQARLDVARRGSL